MLESETLDISDKNIIEVESLDFGEITILLTNDQIEDMLERGARVLVDFREDIENNSEELDEDESWYASEDYSDPDNSFSTRSVDWNSIFSEVSNDELESAIQAASLGGEDIHYKLPENFIVLGVGISSSMGANSGPSNLCSVTVCEASGLFFRD